MTPSTASLRRAGGLVFPALICLAGAVSAQTISIAGPSSGATGQLLQFTASAVGCEPEPGQWFWSLDGGFVGGLDSNALIEVFWDTPGTKALSALNPGCPQVAGETTVQINAPGRLGLGSDVYVAAEGGGQLEIAVVRKDGTDGVATVQYATSSAGATPGSDYTSTSGTLQWADGDDSNQVISVPILDDGLFEDPESFLVTLSNPTGASLAGFVEARVEIEDDDPVPGDVVQFAQAVFEASEHEGAATIRLIRTGTSAGDISVDLTTSDSTATSPADYSSVSTTVQWAAGDVSEKQVQIPLIDDGEQEGTELVDLELSNPDPEAQVFLGANDFAQLILIDDDNPAGSLSWSTPDVSAIESDGTASLVVRRSGGDEGTVTGRVSVTGGSATSGVDFQLPQTTVVFADGDAEDKTIEVTLVDDSDAEGLETIRLALSIDSGSAAVGAPSQATLNIEDDDAGAPDTVRFVAASVRVAETAGTAVLMVERVGNLFGDATVVVNTSGGSATLGQDFNFSPLQIVWNNGEGGARSVPVTILNDTTPEDLETAGFNLTAPQGATLGIPSVATVEIGDDDSGFLDVLTPSLQLSEPDDVGVLLVERSGPSGEPASARLSLSGTAQRDVDFEIDTTQLTWNAGESGVRQIEIRILDDDDSDPGETIVIELVDVEGPAVLRGLAQVTIGDDDLSLPAPQFEALGNLRGPTLVTRHDAQDRASFTEIWLDDQNRVLRRSGTDGFEPLGISSTALPAAAVDLDGRLLVLVTDAGEVEVHCIEDRIQPIASCGTFIIGTVTEPSALRLDAGPDGTIAAAWIEGESDGAAHLRLLGDGLLPRTGVLELGSAADVDLAVHDLGAVAVARRTGTATFLEILGENGERFSDSDLGRALELEPAGGQDRDILGVALDFDASGALVVATAESVPAGFGSAFVRRLDARTASLLDGPGTALEFGTGVTGVDLVANRGGDVLLATAGPTGAQVFSLAEGVRRGPAFAFAADPSTQTPALPALAVGDDDRTAIVVKRQEIGSSNFAVESFEFTLPMTPGACADEPGQNDPLCLTGERFEITVQWQDFAGNIGSGQPFALTADSGYLWFFEEDNVEVLLKVLDACSFTGGFWVFGTGLTDTEVSLVVDDSVSGRTRTYFNPLRSRFEPIQEVNAFETCDAPGARFVALRQHAAVGGTLRTAQGATPSIPVVTRPAETAPCMSNDTTLCLNQDRFRVEIEWATNQGTEGVGRAVELTGDTGSFTFFDPDNVEVVIKVLDACDFNGHYWVFAGGLTDVETRMTVTDAATESEREYVNALGSAFEPILDVEAFPCQ